MNCLNLDWTRIVIFLILLIWEAWLGKTSMLKSNSTIELIFNILRGKK